MFTKLFIISYHIIFNLFNYENVFNIAIIILVQSIYVLWFYFYLYLITIDIFCMYIILLLVYFLSPRGMARESHNSIISREFFKNHPIYSMLSYYIAGHLWPSKIQCIRWKDLIEFWNSMIIGFISWIYCCYHFDGGCSDIWFGAMHMMKDFGFSLPFLFKVSWINCCKFYD